MKKLLCAMPFVLILASSCQKEIPTKLNGYFYTTDSSSSEQVLKLFVDGKEIGDLPYINKSIESMSGSIDSNLKAMALHFDFMSGKHLMQAKKADGTILSSSEMYFEFYKNKTKSGVKGGIGASGSASFTNKSEVAIWLASQMKK